MKKYYSIYSLWIGIASAIYALIYLITPLGNMGLFWMSFVSLPIYFTAGAKVKEFPHYFLSMICGIGWGVINIKFIGWLVDMGMSNIWANVIDLLFITVICLLIHLMFLGETWLGKVPMVFGGLSMTFSQGGQNLAGIGLTLAGGLVLGLAFSIGGNLIKSKVIANVENNTILES